MPRGAGRVGQRVIVWAKKATWRREPATVPRAPAKKRCEATGPALWNKGVMRAQAGRSQRPPRVPPPHPFPHPAFPPARDAAKCKTGQKSLVTGLSARFQRALRPAGGRIVAPLVSL